MTTLTDRPSTALLVIDVQNGVVTGTPNRDGVVANINTLVGEARAQGMPVVWVQHSDEGMPRGYDVTMIADAHTTSDKTAWGDRPPSR